jgi:hypothetical protein
MFRKLALTLVAATALGTAAIAPTTASAWGGHGFHGFHGGYHGFHGFHGYRYGWGYRGYGYRYGWGYGYNWCYWHPYACYYR